MKHALDPDMYVRTDFEVRVMFFGSYHNERTDNVTGLLMLLSTLRGQMKIGERVTI